MLHKARTGEPEQRWHHQIVADHCRERDSLNDHHTGSGGQSTNKHQQRQQFMPLRHRQRQYESICIYSAVRKMQQTAESDRQHE